MYGIYLDEKDRIRKLNDLTYKQIISWINRNHGRLISSTPRGKTKIGFIDTSQGVIELLESGGWSVKIEEVIDVDRYIRNQLLLGDAPTREECKDATGIRNKVYAPQIAYQIRKDS